MVLRRGGGKEGSRGDHLPRAGILQAGGLGYKRISKRPPGYGQRHSLVQLMHSLQQHAQELRISVGWGVQQKKRVKGVESAHAKAALQGHHVQSRYNLGIAVMRKGNHDRTVRHLQILAKVGGTKRDPCVELDDALRFIIEILTH